MIATHAKLTHGPPMAGAAAVEGAKERESCPDIDAWAGSAPRSDGGVRRAASRQSEAWLGGGQQRFRDGEAERFPLPVAQRPPRIAALERELDELHRAEEVLVAAAIAAVHRSPSAPRRKT